MVTIKMNLKEMYYENVMNLMIASKHILTLLGSGHQNLHETYHCRMYSRKLLMMGSEDARNM